MITNYDLDEVNKIVQILVNKERLPHVLGTAKFASTLAKIHGLDTRIAEFLGYIHDVFRDLPEEKLLKMSKAYGIDITLEDRMHPILLHGKIAAEYIKFRFKIVDEDILNAVRYHTSGFKSFGVYGKLLFLADSLEETRNYPKVSYLREVAYKDLNMAFFEVMKNKIMYALSRNLFILKESVECWNYLISKRKGGLK
ncbi:metal-dependent phosphohydrolase [Thermosipho affectus]|uniref:bis(5'-nucleosyl)-tetraphosphatase (symmetrical) n=1 Tax=Thermosipho affectus TaxID=660294 RepID=A0ABX3IKW9_9BACT|nr:bis(5'-nucleosyl)-tetraphosphatase (symmetrical) YqeK [Thermosipho affectus]ONN27806.1 metal-dependent phosphohydrolase [Thermosipho affectus]